MFNEKFWEHASRLGSGILIAIVIFWGFNQFANRIADTNKRQADTLQEVSNAMTSMQENLRESTRTQKENQRKIIQLLSQNENF